MYNFDEPWARQALDGILRPDMTVTVLPFSFAADTTAEGFLREFGPDGEHRKAVLRPFAAYGIGADQVRFVNYFVHSPAEARALVEGADVVFLTGGLPDLAMDRVREFGLEDLLARFPGVLMGASAGAMMQISDYHISPDEDYPAYQRSRGLDCGLDFDVEVHYVFSPVQNDGIRRALSERPVPVWAMENTGGLLVRDGQVTPLGDVHLVRTAAEIPAAR
jgi:peptidase E